MGHRGLRGHVGGQVISFIMFDKVFDRGTKLQSQRKCDYIP